MSTLGVIKDISSGTTFNSKGTTIDVPNNFLTSDIGPCSEISEEVKVKTIGDLFLDLLGQSIKLQSNRRSSTVSEGGDDIDGIKGVDIALAKSAGIEEE